jgi:hypothetical protein
MIKLIIFSAICTASQILIIIGYLHHQLTDFAYAYLFGQAIFVLLIIGDAIFSRISRES